MAKFDRDKALEIIRNGSETEQRQLVDELAHMLERKRYGLVWERGGGSEDSPFEAEDVVLQLSSGIPYPVYREDLSTRPDHGGNMLLEGDNYVWLKVLEQTHKGKIDVIYIDPPYNTERKDFKYNDKFVGKDDIFRHSKWLDFMDKRLRIAKSLLSDNGVIFISCDEHEQAPLKLLSDEIFGIENFISTLIWNTKNASKGVPPLRMITNIHEYVLVYAKNDQFKFKGVERTTDDFDNPDNDPRGLWRKEALVSTTSKKRFEIEDPATGNKFYRAWAFSPENIQKMIKENKVIFPKNEKGTPLQKKFFNDYTNDGKPIVSQIGTFQTRKATSDLMDIFSNEKVFDFPKPVSLLRYLLDQSTSESSIILDFFAGSGTTAQAVEELNANDGGHRQWILVTNNEDQGKDDGDPETGICRDVTKPRIDTIITGIRPDGTEYSKGIDSGYSYYQYDFNARTSSKDKNARAFHKTKALAPFIAIKYGAHKIDTITDKKALVYDNDNDFIVLTVDDNITQNDINDIARGHELGERSIIAIVPDGSPADLDEITDNITVIPFSILTDRQYLEGRN